MRENLEYRVKDFRERMMGRDLSERYPIEFSENGTIVQKEIPSGSDTAKIFSRLFGKLMVPYTGDKSMMELVELESELNPERRHQFCFCGGGFIGVKYVLLVHLAYKLYTHLGF